MDQEATQATTETPIPPDVSAEELLEPLGWMITGQIRGRIDSWSQSRVCVRGDGKTSTVLVELTRLLYPNVDIIEALKPYWKDRDPEHEVFSNIALGAPVNIEVVTKDGETTTIVTRKRGKPRGNNYGAQSHSPEYQRAYYQKNKARIAASQRKYYEKVRDKYRQATEAEPKAPSTEPKFETFTEEMQERLEKIAAMAGVGGLDPKKEGEEK